MATETETTTDTTESRVLDIWAQEQAELISALQEHRREIVAHWGTGSATVAKVDKMIATARRVYGQIVFGAERYEELAGKMSTGRLGAWIAPLGN